MASEYLARVKLEDPSYNVHRRCALQWQWCLNSSTDRIRRIWEEIVKLEMESRHSGLGRKLSFSDDEPYGPRMNGFREELTHAILLHRRFGLCGGSRC